MTVTPLPAAASELASRIDARLAELLRTELERWAEVDPDLADPFTTLRNRVLSGGKRLRPAFCYWSFIGAGGSPDEPAIVDAGAALEMLHTAALVHDDVIDGSARRHGLPTAHVEHASRHATGGWKGDADSFGSGVAILLGDLALVYSDRLMAGAPAEAAAVFDEMRLEVNVGQYLDVLGTALGVGGPSDAAVARAQRICRYKTAKYTVERPLHLGAALAAADRLPELTGPLSRFGLPLGEAFQLRDDLLGVFGNPDVTGKPVGDDLREGKPTLLASLAARAAAGPAATLWSTRFGAADLTPPEVSSFQEVIESTGARDQVEAAISVLVETAVAALGDLPLTGEAVSALAELAAFVAGRDR